jgi:hypothetical protein
MCRAVIGQVLYDAKLASCPTRTAIRHNRPLQSTIYQVFSQNYSFATDTKELARGADTSYTTLKSSRPRLGWFHHFAWILAKSRRSAFSTSIFPAFSNCLDLGAIPSEDCRLISTIIDESDRPGISIWG